MTPDERKAWAYRNLENWTRDVEIGEFWDEVAGREDDVTDALNSIERDMDELARQVDAHDDRLSELEDAQAAS